MASDKDVNLQIGADASQANAEFERLAEQAMTSSQRIQSAFREASVQMQESMRQAHEQMSSSFNLITESAKLVQSSMIAISAIAAGGAMFKSVIESTTEYYSESAKLARVLGTTATEASTLIQVLDNIHVNTDEYTTAAKGLEKQLYKNESRLQAQGLQTRDSAGNLRPLNELMLDAVGILNQYEEGSSRNVRAIALFGKGLQDGSNLLKMNRKDAEDARRSNDELNLTVGPRGAANAKEYKDAMKDLGDVFQGIAKTISDSVIPALTSFANFIRSIAPTAIDVLKQSLAYLESSLIGVRYLFDVVVESIKFFSNATSAAFEGVRNAVERFAHGDLTGAADAARRAAAKISDAFAAASNNIHNDALRARLSLEDIWNDDKEQPKKKTKTRTSPESEGAPPSRYAEWKSQLELQLESERNFFKSSLDEELAYWQSKLALIKGNSKQAAEERRQVNHEIYTLEKRQAQDQLSSELEDLKARASAYKAGSVERIQLAGEAAVRIGETYGIESKEYRAAVKEMEQAARERNANLLKMEEERIQIEEKQKLQSIEMDKMAINLKLQLGQISATEELAALRDLEDQKYQIELQALRDKAELYQADTQEYQDAMRQIEVLAGQHQLALQKINNQTIVEQKNEWTKMMEPLTRAIDQSVQGIVMGTTTMKKALSNIFQSIISEFISLQTKRVVAWIAGENAQTAATVAGVTARGAAEQAGAGQSMLLQAGGIIKKIFNYAWETFSGIFAFLSGMMGPAAAGPAAAGMGTVMATAGSIAFAAQGYDIPSGVNPLVQAHQQEMILPAKYADVIRGMAEGGAPPAASAPVYLQGVDAGQFFIANKKSLMKALKMAGRDFVR